jgi:sugar lactone lactonase YvrE
LACALGAASAIAATSAAGCATATVLKEHANGTFLENLDRSADGTLYYTSYFSKELYRWDASSGASLFATLAAHPVSIHVLPTGYLVAAHGKPFSEGPAFTQTNQLLVLDKGGSVLQTIAAPTALFLNGLVEMGNGKFLLADSIAATLWQLDLASATLTPWLKAEWLSQDPAVKAFKPGANGLKLHKGWLYVSNSSRGTLSRIKVSGQQPVGDVQVVARPGSIDDFVVMPDGVVYAATHARDLARIGTDGKAEPILREGVDGSTALTVLREKPSLQLAALSTGGVLEGGKAPARLTLVDMKTWQAGKCK